MTTKKLISGLIVLVLLSTVLTSFVFANGDGCPTTADYYVTGTVNSNSNYYIYKGDIPGLPSDYYIKNDEPFCVSCGDADTKGDYPDRYIKYNSESCCGPVTFYFYVGKSGFDKRVKVTLDVVQSYDYSITATIHSGDIYKLYMNDDQLPDDFEFDEFKCTSGICGELKYKRVDGPNYIQYVPYEEECSDCHWECSDCGWKCWDCDWGCSTCEDRDCCGDNTFYFKIKEKERYEDCHNEWVCDSGYWHYGHWKCTSGHFEQRCHWETRTIPKIVKVTVTVDCTPPCDTAPIANDDSYTTNENACAIFNVLENDIDPDHIDSPNLTIVDVTVPEYGTAQISGNKIYYCPQGNYCGEDAFYYKIKNENGCDESNYAKVIVTIPCKTPLPESILYPGIGLERLTIPGGPIPIDGSIGAVLDSGTNIIADGKVVSSLELLPGTQTLLVQVENRGSLTQTDVGVRFEGLPEGVTFNLEPELQKITAHNIGTYILTLTASPNVQPGTYTVKATAYSAMGSLDEIVLNVIIK